MNGPRLSNTRHYHCARRVRTRAPEAVAFYEFTRTMQAYKSIVAENTTLVVSTDGDLFKFLKGISPKADVVPS